MGQEQNSLHHHHHHHHHEHSKKYVDSATRFKYDSLASIRRRKLIAKWGFRVLCVLAALSVLALIAVYTIG